MNGRAGFTLMELILAVAVVGLLGSLVFSTVAVQDKVDRAAVMSMEADQLARVALDRVARDIESMLSPDQTEGFGAPLSGEPTDTAVESEPVMSLLTRGGGAEPVVRAEYFLARTEKTDAGPLYLYRREISLLGLKTGEKELLCRRINRLELEYFSPEGEKTKSWTGEFPPRAILVRLILADRENSELIYERLVMPLVALAWSVQ